VTPLLPLLLYFALHLDPILAFAFSAIFGAVVTRGTRTIETLVASAIRGIEDVAPAVLLFIGIGMLLTATKTPQFTAALTPLVHGWANNPFAYVAIFGLCSPLVLYRGPLNPFGVGIAVFTVLLTAHVLPPVVIVAAVMAVVQVQNVCDPTNTSNVWVANFTGVPVDTITRRTLPFQTAVAVVATLAVVLGAPELFGKPSFTSIYSMASAAEVLPGFYAPAASSGRIAVDDDGTLFGRTAADAVAASLHGEQWTAFRLRDDPNARDCARKSYAAYLLVESSVFRLTEGDDLDVGLRLEDCGGWFVDEWHDHQVFAPHPTDGDARALGIAGVARLRAWALAQPVRSGNLFARGAAVSPNEKPTYFYSLFRTIDGNMRVYVRAGGPAYAAGLRSGEVIEKIDGRDWWLYGTYPAEQLAYDGKPHAFEVVQSGRNNLVTLGAPFVFSAGDER
jgi:hypothetical protein